MSEGEIQEHGEDWQYRWELPFNYENAIWRSRMNDMDLAGHYYDEEVEAVISGVVSGELAARSLSDVFVKIHLTPEEIRMKKAKSYASGEEARLNQKSNIDALTVAVKDGDELLVDALKEKVSSSVLRRMISEALESGLTDFADDILNDIKNTGNNKYRKVAVRDVILLASRQGDMDLFRYFMGQAKEVCSFLYDTEDDRSIKALFLASMSGGGSPVKAALGTKEDIALDVVKILHHEYGFRVYPYIGVSSPAMKVVCP